MNVAGMKDSYELTYALATNCDWWFTDAHIGGLRQTISTACTESLVLRQINVHDSDTHSMCNADGPTLGQIQLDTTMFRSGTGHE